MPLKCSRFCFMSTRRQENARSPAHCAGVRSRTPSGCGTTPRASTPLESRATNTRAASAQRFGMVACPRAPRLSDTMLKRVLCVFEARRHSLASCRRGCVCVRAYVCDDTQMFSTASARVCVCVRGGGGSCASVCRKIICSLSATLCLMCVCVCVCVCVCLTQTLLYRCTARWRT